MGISQFPVQFPIFYEDGNLKSIFQTFTLNESLNCTNILEIFIRRSIRGVVELSGEIKKNSLSPSVYPLRKEWLCEIW